MIKNIFMKAVNIAIAGVIAMGIGVQTGEVRAYAADEKGKITVNGSGSVSVKPDIAYINLGVTTQNKDSKVAQEENSAQMNKVIAAIKAQGVEEKDIQTSDYSIYAERDYQNGSKITGYTVNNSVKLTVRKLDQVGAIIDKAFSAGANAGGGISFSISDSGPYYEQAMDQAIKNATAKAKAIGKSLGVTISNPVEINEAGGYYAPILYGDAKLMNADTGGGAVQAGELNVTANIQAVFTY